MAFRACAAFGVYRFGAVYWLFRVLDFSGLSGFDGSRFRLLSSLLLEILKGSIQGTYKVPKGFRVFSMLGFRDIGVETCNIGVGIFTNLISRGTLVYFCHSMPRNPVPIMKIRFRLLGS